MGIFDWKHWLILLVVVVLVFGTKKLKNFGSDLGESIKGFRKAMNSEEDEVRPPQQPVTPPPGQPLNPPHTFEADAHKVDEPARRD
ncbi:twin-arginine translocase TatA/TatE family subunit [Pseudomonas mangiferae]|uniref:Sec-independent protein translocase protein TatA n=1 Tax=Pseudomonas mangiferae TaxID=2593654 RepID=A0A553GYW4_9PSED|nr:twin-arginine translocase TatA/TatE family subunit [Pseudomonas mangiferae]TRX74684.1 twin-arginine translocase TatA/TatE family subunit [Pseudomonas mangiferae]